MLTQLKTKKSVVDGELVVERTRRLIPENLKEYFVWFRAFSSGDIRHWMYLPVDERYDGRYGQLMVLIPIWPFVFTARKMGEINIRLARWAYRKGYLTVDESMNGTICRFWPKHLNGWVRIVSLWKTVKVSVRKVAYNECSCGGKMIPYDYKKDVCNQCGKQQK